MIFSEHHIKNIFTYLPIIDEKQKLETKIKEHNLYQSIKISIDFN